MRFWPLFKTNNLDAKTFENALVAKANKQGQVRDFVSQETPTSLRAYRNTWSHKAFDVSELRYCCGDALSEFTG